MTAKSWTATALKGALLVCAAVLTLNAALLSANSVRAEPAHIRVAVVNTPMFSGLMDALIDDFKATGGAPVDVYSGSDVYQKARAGGADLVISHYGKAEVERFVLDGLGHWPQMVFSNQLAIIGPKSDPAKIKGLPSATDALRRIAEARAPFVVNELHGIMYLSDVLWEAAGKPDKGAWYLKDGVSKGRAIGYAESRQAYVIWGAMPFLRYKSKHSSDMELMVTSDPMLHRVMASIRINPEKTQGVNAEGALAFEKYLLSPRAQARIAAFRTPGTVEQLWWPAARNNATEGLDE